jgi:hypothetical protein
MEATAQPGLVVLEATEVFQVAGEAEAVLGLLLGRLAAMVAVAK